MSTDNLFTVEDQVVFVSGGSRGIGRAIAAGFAARGAKVILGGREEATLKATGEEISVHEGEATRHAVKYVVCDVADEKSITTAVPQVMDIHGPIDCLINVAGVNVRKPVETYTVDEFDKILDINMRGAYLLSVEVGRHMLQRGAGNQINITSLNNYAPLLQVAPYAMSKAAMGHMTRSLACEWGPRGIRVNAISPGFILTDLTKKLWSREDMQAWNQQNCPQQRLGIPEDMVGTALFLASPASAFMTGQILFVDGGFSAGMRWPI